MSAPLVKGWCPTAYRPMASGDGLIVRIRPRLARLTTAQTLGLCDCAQAFGNGFIDLTSRASLQLRGVTNSTLPALLQALDALHLLDPNTETEARRNILTTPFWEADDLTTMLHARIIHGLPQFPDLPAKMGIVVDTGAYPILQEASGDFRFERTSTGALILRADGASSGQQIAPDDAVPALLDLAHWFLRGGGAKAGRMARHLAGADLPAAFQGIAPAPAQPAPRPGLAAPYVVYGAPFGQIEAKALARLLKDTQATALRTTPWRMLFLEEAQPVPHPAFTLEPDAASLRVFACPGAPACTQAHASTRDLAAALAPCLPDGKTLHVSGCAKGCAHPGPADFTFVAQDGRFNLVPTGRAWDEPARRGLSASDITDILRP